MSLMDVRLQAHKNSGNCTGPDCTHMSHGGDVKQKSRDHNETGVHPQFSFNGQKGSSLAGEYARNDKKDLSKSLHSQHLQQLKSMPNPKLQGLAKGGEVGVHSEQRKGRSGAGILAEGVGYARAGGGEHASMLRDESRKLHSDKLSELKQMPKPKLQGLAEGGEVESMDMDDDMDNEMMDMAAGELLSAIEKKDKKEILESIKALVLSCKG